MDLGRTINTLSEVRSFVSSRKISATLGSQMWDTAEPKVSSGSALALPLLWVMTHANEAKVL